MKNKNILIIVAIALIGLTLVGSTYAYLTFSLDITNDNYNNISTHCFGITYNVNNVDGSTDITGTLFPSSAPTKGLNGRVGFSSDETCSITGLGTIKLNIASTTSSTLTTPASSYCESRSTLEPMTEYTTESSCNEAGGRWRGYGDAYCENPNTLVRMEDYTTESECTTNSGSWVTGGSPLKYAVYTSTDANASPVSVGRINSTDIGNTITIYDNFSVTPTMTYYYIYIWLDGYLTDNTHTNLPFNANITASVRQNPNASPVAPTASYTYTVNIYDENATGYNSVWIGQTIPSGITQYTSPGEAITALEAAFSSANSGATTSLPFFLRHKIGNGTVWCTTGDGNTYCPFETQSECESANVGTCTSSVVTNGVTESYVGFTVSQELASANSGMSAGTYYIKGGDNGRAYNENKATLLSAFGSSYCTQYSSGFECFVSGLRADAKPNGRVLGEYSGSSCIVNSDGYSRCVVIY